MYLVGTVTLSKVVEKEWEGRKYYKCQAVGSDKEIYSLTLNSAEAPRSGDVYQIVLEPSDRDWKPYVHFQREK